MKHRRRIRYISYPPNRLRQYLTEWAKANGRTHGQAVIELAKYAGVLRGHIYAIENETCRPSEETKALILAFLGLRPEEATSVFPLPIVCENITRQKRRID